jgi:hypothetical protein
MGWLCDTHTGVHIVLCGAKGAEPDEASQQDSRTHTAWGTYIPGQNMPVDANEQFDGDFTLMCAELNQMLSALLEALEEKVITAKAA